ncbi:hypothetical protein HMP0721_0238 [Pseudoramibacter alactolyticus ATCC 23263]|uniref:Uncharacterized protein n=1 Tax=Pseudoramibacter alactolyticus ATCC 23263 TaxID=887929 RepID=E6ME05_9FIRM|nr:hypothetical protein HMP0721_0238 [Pseudoramibacter alactolyticus ATCC 23263]
MWGQRPGQSGCWGFIFNGSFFYWRKMPASVYRRYEKEKAFCGQKIAKTLAGG